MGSFGLSEISTKMYHVCMKYDDEDIGTTHNLSLSSYDTSLTELLEIFREQKIRLKLHK